VIGTNTIIVVTNNINTKKTADFMTKFALVPVELCAGPKMRTNAIVMITVDNIHTTNGPVFMTDFDVKIGIIELIAF